MFYLFENVIGKGWACGSLVNIRLRTQKVQRTGLKRRGPDRLALGCADQMTITEVIWKYFTSETPGARNRGKG